MRISSSNIQFASQHVETQTYTQKETITERIRQIQEDAPNRTTTRAQNETDRPQTPPRFNISDTVNLSNRFEGLGTLMQRATQTIKDNTIVNTATPTEGMNPEDFEFSAEDKAKIEMIIAAVERITGKKIKLVEPDKALKEAYQTPTLDSLPVMAQMKADQQAAQEAIETAPPPTQIREVRYQFEESYYEAESTS
ncbi:MAG: hypothetical protein ACO36I_12135, partial [Candidatus Latescibacterota bacterium]